METKPQELKPANISDINPGDIVTVLGWKSGHDRSWIGEKFTVKEVKPPFLRVLLPWSSGSEYSLDTRFVEVALWDAKPKPATLRQALARLTDSTRSTEAHFRDVADALEIMVLFGKDTDARDMDRDITNLRGN